MVWSAPNSLALRRILSYMVPGFFMLFDVCCLVRLRRPECRLGSLVDVVVLSWLDDVRRCNQVLSPPTGGSAPMKVMPLSMCPSTRLRAAASASSLSVNPVCDFTLHMRVLYSRVPLV